MLRLLTGLAAAIVAVAGLAAFWGLDATSLWLDELATRYFADPAVVGFGAALRRALEDVNSPAYYLVTWAVQRISGLDFVLAARGVAALGAVAALALLLGVRAGQAGLAARLVAGVFVVAAPVWFDYAQEARAYGLALCLDMAMALWALRLLPRVRAGEGRGLSGLAGLAVLAALNHYYALFLAGGLFAMLLAFSRSWKAAALVALWGLSVVAVVGGFVAWHRPQMVLDIHDTWFSASPEFLTALTWHGLEDLFGGWQTQGLAGLILLLAMAGKGWGRAAAPLGLLLGAAVLTFALALGVTLAFTPMISARIFVVLAPLVWLALAELAEIAMRTPWPRLAAGLMALALGVVAPGALDRGRDVKQPWRASAEVVASLPGCRSATLPVLWLSDHFIRDDDPEWLYGFYLPKDPARRYIALQRRDLPQALEAPALQDLVRETASGARICPVLLWAGTGWVSDPDAAIASLSKALPPEGGRIEAQVIRAKDSSASIQIFLWQP
jgi:uncharacterized membrane protein